MQGSALRTYPGFRVLTACAKRPILRGATKTSVRSSRSRSHAVVCRNNFGGCARQAGDVIRNVVEEMQTKLGEAMYCEYIPQGAAEKCVERLTMLFTVYDKDGDGFISGAELKYMLNVLDGEDDLVEFSKSIPEIMDLDRDGLVSFEEFINAFFTNDMDDVAGLSRYLVTLLDRLQKIENRRLAEIEAALEDLGLTDKELRQVLFERLDANSPSPAPSSLDDEHLTEVRKLKKVPLLVMDNSLRESTVAALRGHTIDDKWRILEQVEKCGFEHIILGALNGTEGRVDDIFAQQVRDAEDFEERHEGRYFAFSEITDRVIDEAWDPSIPAALQKMKRYRIHNPIIEVDLAAAGVDYDSFNAVVMARDLLQWCADNLGSAEKPPRLCFNMRDFFPAMESNPERVEWFVRGMAALPAGLRPWAMMTEEPTGSYLPHTMATYIRRYREWWGPVSLQGVEGGGNLCIHVHKGFGLAEASVLASLGGGANGIWCGVAETGAALGHAGSALTITNLARFGNPVAQAVDGGVLREAAVAVTRITTGQDPDPTTEIYGARANQWVFDFAGMGDEFVGARWQFDQAAYLGVKKEARIHTLSTVSQFRARLEETLGTAIDLDDEAITKMREVMLADLRESRKLEYQTAEGVWALYRRAGGQIPEYVLDEIEYQAQITESIDPAILEVKQAWDAHVEDTGLRGSIAFRAFYDAFLARFFGCYCWHTKHVAQVVWKFFDLNGDGVLEWVEFLSWLHWTALEYPEECSTGKELIQTLFTRIIMPDMRRGLDIVETQVEA